MGKLLIDSINRLDRPIIVAYLMMTVADLRVINLAVTCSTPRSTRACGSPTPRAEAMADTSRRRTRRLPTAPRPPGPAGADGESLLAPRPEFVRSTARCSASWC
jgi:hypothetical protein